MFHLSFNARHQVLRFTFDGVLDPETLDGSDTALIEFLGGAGRTYRKIRSLYDMSGVRGVAVPYTKCVERAHRPPVGGLPRFVVVPDGADEQFGRYYSAEQRQALHPEPVFVRSVADAYDRLGLVNPRFGPLI
jgi:hypothetical protein